MSQIDEALETIRRITELKGQPLTMVEQNEIRAKVKAHQTFIANAIAKAPGKRTKEEKEAIKKAMQSNR